MTKPYICTRWNEGVDLTECKEKTGCEGCILGIIAGGNITIDNSSPQYPIVSASGCANCIDSIVAGDNISIDNTDPKRPIVSAQPGGTGDMMKSEYDPNGDVAGAGGVVSYVNIAQSAIWDEIARHRQELDDALLNKANVEYTEETLTLSASVGGSVMYWKDDFGFVHLRGSLTTPTGNSISPGTTLGYLPVGFYLPRQFSFPVALFSTISGTYSGDVAAIGVDTSGTMTLLPSISLGASFKGGGLNFNGDCFYAGV